MKFETVKSFILICLVVISISLTLGLWYYQPVYDELYEEGSVGELETDIGGKENNLPDVVIPNDVIFHNNVTEQHFTFEHPSEYIQLYHKMQSWSLTEFEDRIVQGIPKDDEQVEIRFPTEIPMSLLGNLFSVSDDVALPTWSFQNIFISFDKSSSLLEFTFVSKDKKNSSTAKVHHKNAYDLLWAYISAPQGMEQLIASDITDKDDEPIYIPYEAISMTGYTLSIDEIDPNRLVNALFNKPSLVSTNSAESYFTDGLRGMDLLNNNMSVEFFNPYSGTYDRMEVSDLLDKTINKINDHMGWTNDYYLFDVEASTNQVKFQMHYKGYPVFDYSNLSSIILQWRNQELYQYDRPLFQIKNVLRQDTKTLVSGEQVIEKLKNSPNYNMSKIRDLKVGYRLSYKESTQTITLNPAWYVNYDGNWRELSFEEDDELRE